jgi:hypothetical protein
MCTGDEQDLKLEIIIQYSDKIGFDVLDKLVREYIFYEINKALTFDTTHYLHFTCVNTIVLYMLKCLSWH